METVKTNSIKAWLLAARPKTLVGAAVPVMLGCALAAADGWFQIVPATLCFLFAFLMQIDANFINDFFDYLKGSDREDRLGPERACAQGWITLEAMKRGIALTTHVGLCGWSLAAFLQWSRDDSGRTAVYSVCFFIYCRSLSFGLSWLGRRTGHHLLRFCARGCTYYVMCHDWTWNVTIASVVCGMIIDTLLMVNNYRDRTGCVKRQENTGRKMGCGNRAYALSVFRIGSRMVMPLVCRQRTYMVAILPQIYILPHFLTWQRMVKINKGKS